MSGQLESQHFFQAGDTVRDRSGMLGEVIDAFALYASIAWSDGRRTEVDQFEPTVVVIDRKRS